MNYIKISIDGIDTEMHEILIALLSDKGYEGFEESEDSLFAFIPERDWNEAALKEILSPFNIKFSFKQILPENWNATWEAGFEPVIVGNFCTIRAAFHNLKTTTKHEIIITPKMSFGTGHHATTQLMILLMKEIDFRGKDVLDFGTGTGVLAILAQKMEAGKVDAIDNDDWSYNNALENISMNNCDNIIIKQGTLDIVGNKVFDIILANINRHILLEYMDDLYSQCRAGGSLILSGILTEDIDMIVNSAQQAGFQYGAELGLNNWVAIKFEKL